MARRRRQQNVTHIGEDWLTTNQVAGLLGVTILTICNWRRDKGFPFIVVPGQARNSIRFDHGDVLHWAEQNNMEVTQVV